MNVLEFKKKLAFFLLGTTMLCGHSSATTSPGALREQQKQEEQLNLEKYIAYAKDPSSSPSNKELKRAGEFLRGKGYITEEQKIALKKEGPAITSFQKDVSSIATPIRASGSKNSLDSDVPTVVPAYESTSSSNRSSPLSIGGLDLNDKFDAVAGKNSDTSSSASSATTVISTASLDSIIAQYKILEIDLIKEIEEIDIKLRKLRKENELARDIINTLRLKNNNLNTEIKENENKFNDLQDKNDENKARANHNKKIIEKNNKKISDLQTKSSSDEEEIHRLESLNQNLTIQIGLVETENNRFKEEISRLKNENGIISDNNKDLDILLTRENKKVEDLRNIITNKNKIHSKYVQEQTAKRKNLKTEAMEALQRKNAQRKETYDRHKAGMEKKEDDLFNEQVLHGATQGELEAEKRNHRLAEEARLRSEGEHAATEAERVRIAEQHRLAEEARLRSEDAHAATEAERIRIEQQRAEEIRVHIDQQLAAAERRRAERDREEEEYQQRIRAREAEHQQRLREQDEAARLEAWNRGARGGRR